MASDTGNPDLQRFTAAGRPMPAKDQSGWAAGSTNMGSGGFTVADSSNTLPFIFKDHNFISVAIKQELIDEALGTNGSSANDTTSLAASDAPLVNSSSADSSGRRKSFLSKFTKKSSSDSSSGKSKKGGFQMVKMQRGEYLKYFAKDDDGKYCGTAPEGDPGRLEVLRTRLGDEALQARGRNDTIASDWKGSSPGEVLSKGLANMAGPGA